jgi:hypothetical protein
VEKDWRMRGEWLEYTVSGGKVEDEWRMKDIGS